VHEITPENVGDYLHERRIVPAASAVRAQALGWGVSNVVIRVDVQGRAPIVIKQSRGELRTNMRWVSRIDRIWSEVEALCILSNVLPAGSVPTVLVDDQANFLFAMTCAPNDSIVWKEQLLNGIVDPATAATAGKRLSVMHGDVAARRTVASRLRDRTVFDELRIDPFYRVVRSVHPDLSQRLSDLVEQALDPPEVTFVHADFSPKNILVHSAGLTLVDFETAHAGDPAFDLGFFASHLLLKAIRQYVRAGAGAELPIIRLLDAFWVAYWPSVAERLRPGRDDRGARHAAACTLARIDGKSPVDYLDAGGQGIARRFALAALLQDAHGWRELTEILAREMRTA
jgi:5-methylthioribose kinase